MPCDSWPKALRFSLDHALRDRGGILEVRRRSGGHPNHFGIRLDLQLPRAVGLVCISDCSETGVVVTASSGKSASCSVRRATALTRSLTAKWLPARYLNSPACASDRLYLVNMSGLDVFRPLYDALSGMGFYNLNPEAICDLQSPDPGELLKRDGSNLASVLSNFDSDRKKDVEEYLAAITPGVTGVVAQAMGAKLTLDFRQEVRGAKNPWRFPASNMSDGTLRALGVLVALFQGSGGAPGLRHLVGIEEPESALHPAAAEVLIDSLTDASQLAQVMVTSHSADLLDNDSIPRQLDPRRTL